MGKKENVTNTFPNVHNSHTTFALLYMACVCNKYTDDGLTFNFFSTRIIDLFSLVLFFLTLIMSQSLLEDILHSHTD